MPCDVEYIDDDEYAELERMLCAVEANRGSVQDLDPSAKRPCIAAAMQITTGDVSHSDDADRDLLPETIGMDTGAGSHAAQPALGLIPEAVASGPDSSDPTEARSREINGSCSIRETGPAPPAAAAAPPSPTPMRPHPTNARRKLPQSFSQHQARAPSTASLNLARAPASAEGAALLASAVGSRPPADTTGPVAGDHRRSTSDVAGDQRGKENDARGVPATVLGPLPASASDPLPGDEGDGSKPPGPCALPPQRPPTATTPPNRPLVFKGNIR